MSAIAPSPVMTLEQMHALPDDGTQRELIRGQLRERPMTKRNRWHSRVETRIAKMLDNWLDTQPEPRGQIVSGEAGFRLSVNPDSGVGIDVAYVSAEVAAATPEKAAYFEGPPVLAVEILSPSDRQEEIDEKVALYLETGVLLVWVVSPRFRTVCVYRPGAAPELFNETHELTAEPHLPGFRVAVAQLFGA
ncbi:MAG TPA: Uma2 family endonuclease [Isosphaeraceae bacterium]